MWILSTLTKINYERKFFFKCIYNGMIMGWVAKQKCITILLEERYYRQNWLRTFLKKDERYYIVEKRTVTRHTAEKRTVCRIWILAPGANLKDLMKYINVKNKTITFKDKFVASTFSDIQNTGEQEKEKRSCRAHPMTWVISCAHKIRDAIATTGIFYFDLVLPSSLHKSRDEESDRSAPVTSPTILYTTIRERPYSNTLCILPRNLQAPAH